MTATLERPTQADTLTQPSAVYQLSSLIRDAVDSENQPVANSEIPQVMDALIQQRILDYPHLTQSIQEALDDLRFAV